MLSAPKNSLWWSFQVSHLSVNASDEYQRFSTRQLFARLLYRIIQFNITQSSAIFFLKQQIDNQALDVRSILPRQITVVLHVNLIYQSCYKCGYAIKHFCRYLIAEENNVTNRLRTGGHIPKSIFVKTT